MGNLFVGCHRYTRYVFESPFIAFIDETVRNDSIHGRFYALVAAIVNRNPDYAALVRLMHHVASQQYSGIIHATDMARSEAGRADLSSIEHKIGNNGAVAFFAVAHSPFASGGEEEARQRCVADLAVGLTSAYRVRSVILDSRDPLGNASQSTIPKRGTRNFEDLVTIDGLKGIGEVPKELNISHGNDRLMPGLWIADVAAYSVGHSIADRDPSRLVWIAPHLYIREALTLPVSERVSGSRSMLPSTGMSVYMETLLNRAKAMRQERT